MENIGNKNIVGQKIKEIRRSLCITQHMLAAELEKMGVEMKISTLSKVENQHRGVTDIELVAFAAALNQPIGDLFKK